MSTTTRVPLLLATIKADYAWVSELRYLSEDKADDSQGHCDPYTGEQVHRATGYPSPQPR